MGVYYLALANDSSNEIRDFESRVSDLQSRLKLAFPGIELRAGGDPLADLQQAAGFAGCLTGIPKSNLSSRPIDSICQLIATEQAGWLLILSLPIWDGRELGNILHFWLDEIERLEEIKAVIGEESVEAFRHRVESINSGLWITSVYFGSSTKEKGRQLGECIRGAFTSATREPLTVEPLRLIPLLNVGFAAAAELFATLVIGSSEGRSVLESISNWDTASRLRLSRLRGLRLHTVLTSDELATYFGLPTEERTGFARRPGISAPSQPLATASVRGRRWRLGAAASSAIEVEVPLDPLRFNGVIAGQVGTGKTTTCVELLRSLHAEGIPFLVLEFAKTQYRGLISEMDGLRVYTAGHRTSPLLLNPLELPEEGVDEELFEARQAEALLGTFPLVSGQIPTARNLFNKYFQLARLDPKAPRVLPKLFQTIDRLGLTQMYGSGESADALRGAMQNRVRALMTGVSGRVFNVARSRPAISDLFTRPTVIELDLLPDVDRKLVLMLLLNRIASHIRLLGNSDEKLRFVLVLEEAHRALSPGVQTEGDPQTHLLDLFRNLTSESQAFGLGVIVVDQNPDLLHDAVRRGTSLKIVHQLRNNEAARSMLSDMTPDPDSLIGQVFGLNRGEALVVYEDVPKPTGPILVRVEKTSDLDRPTDAEIRDKMNLCDPSAITQPMPFRSCQACEDPCNYFVESSMVLDSRPYQIQQPVRAREWVRAKYTEFGLQNRPPDDPELLGFFGGIYSKLLLGGSKSILGASFGGEALVRRTAFCALSQLIDDIDPASRVLAKSVVEFVAVRKTPSVVASD